MSLSRWQQVPLFPRTAITLVSPHATLLKPSFSLRIGFSANVKSTVPCLAFL
jgi:hypothetical protein